MKFNAGVSLSDEEVRHPTEAGRETYPMKWVDTQKNVFAKRQRLCFYPLCRFHFVFSLCNPSCNIECSNHGLVLSCSSPRRHLWSPSMYKRVSEHRWLFRGKFSPMRYWVSPCSPLLQPSQLYSDICLGYTWVHSNFTTSHCVTTLPIPITLWTEHPHTSHFLVFGSRC